MEKIFFLLLTIMFSTFSQAQTIKVFTSRVKKIGVIEKPSERYRIIFFAGKRIINNQTEPFVRIKVTNQKQVYTVTQDQYVFCVPQYYEFTITRNDYTQAAKLIKVISSNIRNNTGNATNEYNIMLNDGTIIRYNYPGKQYITIIKNNLAIPTKQVAIFSRYLTMAINQSYKL